MNGTNNNRHDAVQGRTSTAPDRPASPPIFQGFVFALFSTLVARTFGPTTP